MGTKAHSNSANPQKVCCGELCVPVINKRLQDKHSGEAQEGSPGHRVQRLMLCRQRSPLGHTPAHQGTQDSHVTG